MALGLIDRLTNFLMPVEDEFAHEASVVMPERRTPLREVRSHSQQPALKVFIATPSEFDDVRMCADYLKSNVAVLINYEKVDNCEQQRIVDFLSGVCLVTGGGNQRVSDTVVLYAPVYVDINKELYAYSIPTYVKRKGDY